jgi:hypothetical protein
MGYIGMGNNPMVGATVQIAVEGRQNQQQIINYLQGAAARSSFFVCA